MTETHSSTAGLSAAGKKVGLPPRVFLYTLDQICVMIEVTNATLRFGYIYYEGRDIGARKPSLMIARNIAPPDKKPEWRVAEREFIRWMRSKGFKYYEIGGFSN